MLNDFFQSDADVFISGDLRYHDARDAEEAGRALIDIGHFASEHIMIDPVVDYLRHAVKKVDWPLVVEPYRFENDPFCFI